MLTDSVLIVARKLMFSLLLGAEIRLWGELFLGDIFLYKQPFAAIQSIGLNITYSAILYNNIVVLLHTINIL